MIALRLYGSPISSIRWLPLESSRVESSRAWRLWGGIVRLTWLTSDEEPERFVVVVVAVVVASSLGRSSGVRYGRIADGNNKTAIEIRPISRHSADGLQFVLRETHSLT